MPYLARFKNGFFILDLVAALGIISITVGSTVLFLHQLRAYHSQLERAQATNQAVHTACQVLISGGSLAAAQVHSTEPIIRTTGPYGTYQYEIQLSPTQRLYLSGFAP